MKTNHKLIMKLTVLVVLSVMLLVFTQCIGTNSKQVGSTGSEKNTVIDTDDDDDTPTLNETQVSTGIKSHEQILHTMSVLTGVSVTNSSVQATYNQVATTLPTDNDIKVFLPPHQLAITKLAAEFCNALVDSATLRVNIWPTFPFGAIPNNAFIQANRDQIIDETIEAFWGGVYTEDERDMAQEELNTLIFEMLQNEAGNTSATTRNIVKGVCTSVLASAHVTLM